MYHDEYNTNSYVREMAKPGSLITIDSISKYDDYRIKNNFSGTDIFGYTDEMFDPETIKMLLDVSNE
jgi:hypothetical protein